MKYEFTGKTKRHGFITLRQIIRLSDNVIGGWIESETNLTQEGDCFIYANAMVFDKAEVCGDAMVSDTARVSGNAEVYGDAKVFGNASISGNAKVSGKARVYGNVTIYGDAWVYRSCIIFGNSEVYGNAEISGQSIVFGNAKVSGNNVLKKTMLISKPEDIVSFSIDEYNCTATKDFVIIDRYCKTYEKWGEITKEKYIKLGMKEVNYNRYKSFIQFCEISFKNLELGK